jgi:hypothetical protein
MRTWRRLSLTSRPSSRARGTNRHISALTSGNCRWLLSILTATPDYLCLIICQPVNFVIIVPERLWLSTVENVLFINRTDEMSDLQNLDPKWTVEQAWCRLFIYWNETILSGTLASRSKLFQCLLNANDLCVGYNERAAVPLSSLILAC